MFKYFVEFKEVVCKEIREKSGVWLRLALAQTASNPNMIFLLSNGQYIQCLMEAGLEESDIIGDFSMRSKPAVEGLIVSKFFEPFLYFKLKPVKAMAMTNMQSSQERMVWLPTLVSLLSTSTIIQSGSLSLIAMVMSTSGTCKSLETSANSAVVLADVSSACILADAEPVLV